MPRVFVACLMGFALVVPCLRAQETKHPVLKSVLSGKAPDAETLKKAPPAKLLTPNIGDFTLPVWDKPKLLSLSGDAKDSVLVVHLTRPNIDALTADVLKALHKRLGGSGLKIVTALTEGGNEMKLDAALKQQSIAWTVTLDDHAEFRDFVLRESYYLPSFLVVGRDRRAHWISLGKIEDSLAGLCRAVEEELVRKPAERPKGPSAYFPSAEPFTARPIANAGNGNVRFDKKPALLVSTQHNDNGAHLKALAEIATRHRDKLDVVAVVSAETAEQVQKFAQGKPFRVLWQQGALPGCYGPGNRYRLALVAPGGRVFKVLLLAPSFSHYLPVYERYVALLTTLAALPAPASEPARTNVALRISGGNVESATTASDGDANALIDGRFGQPDWSATGGKPEIVLSFGSGEEVSFDRVLLDVRSSIQDVELLAGDDAKGAFRTLGTFRLEDRRGLQALQFAAAKAKFVKVRLLSTYEAKAPFALGEIGVEGVAGGKPAIAFKDGFRDQFAAGRLAYWQQTDVANLQNGPEWKIERGKLIQPRSYLIRGFDRRCTALLHAYPAAGDYRFEATVTKPYGHNAGLMFGFQDWDNFDSLFLLEAQVLLGVRQGNSVRLERRRNGKTEVLSVHGEWFDQSKPVQLEVTCRGKQIAVKANDRLIMSVATAEPVLAGRVGLCTAGASNSTFESVRLTPLGASAPPIPEMNPLSTAAGTTIVWLSGQSGEREPQGWASHLLRDAALSAPGAWIAARRDGKPPEVVFAFRDAREVTLEEIGFTLPVGGDARQRAKQVEVLVTRDSPLLAERFRSVGTFDLADRAELQKFRLATPQAARYVMVRLLENRGAETFSLARVWAKLGAEPMPEPARGTTRTEIEQKFATPAPDKEREPNDKLEQATALAGGKELEAAIQPGEADYFRLPDPPAKKGRASLQMQLTALPWLRLNADLLDASGKPLTPPLARSQAGQIVRQTYSPAPLPRYARVEMPNASLSVVLDMSGSMTGRENDVRMAIKAFFEGVTSTEEVEVIRFDSKVELLAPFTSDRKKLEPIQEQVRMTGATALYKGLLKAMDDLSNRGGNRAILLLSDGMNTISGEDFADLCRRLRAQPVPIYVLGVGQDLFEYDAASGNTCADLVRNLALMTGGKYYFAPKSAELAALYRQLADEIRGATRYRLLARWEVFERHVELMTVRRPSAGVTPFAGALPGAAELDARAIPPVLGPASAGLPPAIADLAVAAPPVHAPPVSRLPLPSPFELSAARPLPPESRLAQPAFPGMLELAEATTASSPAAVPLPSLPEFGQVAVTYKPAGGAPLPKAIRPAIDLILDSSGSMKEEMEGAPKYLAARRVMSNLLKVLPDDATVGLRVFGHMKFWEPTKEPMPEASDKRYTTDSEVVVSIGPLTKERRKLMQDWVAYLTPKGATPLVYSLVQGRNDFPKDWTGPKTVVLISDGIESCGGKLEDVQKAYAGTDIGLLIHVVGFDVKVAKEREFLKTVAKIGRGQYFNAANSDQLADALNKALRSAGYSVRDASGKVAGAGSVNGPALELAAGEYSISIPGTNVKPVRVRIGEGKLLPVALDADGKLIPNRR